MEYKPWEDEPDSFDWVDPDTQLHCAIRRAPSGHLCGYVRLPRRHPWDHRDCDAIRAEVHGGLTFAGDDLINTTLDGSWWIGFDCAHVGDLIPKYPKDQPEVKYRTMGYVKNECTRLCRQVIDAARPILN